MMSPNGGYEILPRIKYNQKQMALSYEFWIFPDKLIYSVCYLKAHFLTREKLYAKVIQMLSFQQLSGIPDISPMAPERP